VDDPLDGGESDPGAGELRGGVESLEGSEELVSVRHVEADAVVANVIHEAIALPPSAELDSRRRLSARELPGIPEQVFEQDAQKVRVPTAH
jgi:hypothetical protein